MDKMLRLNQKVQTPLAKAHHREDNRAVDAFWSEKEWKKAGCSPWENESYAELR